VVEVLTRLPQTPAGAIAVAAAAAAVAEQIALLLLQSQLPGTAWHCLSLAVCSRGCPGKEVTAAQICLLHALLPPLLQALPT
jgi:hypothetical protein